MYIVYLCGGGDVHVCYIYVCMHVCVLDVFMGVWYGPVVYACVWVSGYVYVCVGTHVHVFVCIWTCMCICIYIYVCYMFWVSSM